jgi:AcrR family transcriptional regulator
MMDRLVAKGHSRREEIIAATAALVSEIGPQAVSLKAVGARSGLTHVGVLHHFRSRQELLLAVFVEHERRGRERLDAAWDGGGLATLRRLPEIARAAEDDANFTKLALILAADGLDGNGAVRRYFVDRYRYIRQGLVRTLRRGQEAGEIRPDIDAEAKAAVIAAFIDAIPVQRFVEPDAADIARACDDFVDALIRDVGLLDHAGAG